MSPQWPSSFAAQRALVPRRCWLVRIHLVLLSRLHYVLLLVGLDLVRMAANLENRHDRLARAASLFDREKRNRISAR
jgi:hypothetical protein